MAQRVLEFVETHGGPSVVARKINTKPTLFYHFEAGRSKPSSETLAELAKMYADFDTMYMLTGIPSSAPREVYVAENEKSVIDISAMRLQIENESMKREIESLKEDKARLWGIVTKGDFQEVSSKPTVHRQSHSRTRRLSHRGNMNAPLFENAVPIANMRGL